MPKLSTATMKTRRKRTYPIFGSPKHLQKKCLAIIQTCYAKLSFLNAENERQNYGKQPSLNEISEKLANKQKIYGEKRLSINQSKHFKCATKRCFFQNESIFVTGLYKFGILLVS